MRINSIAFKGLIPFPDEQTVTFPTSNLINLRGPNGGGKSSFLDLIPLVLFKEAPNRTGGLYGQFLEDSKDGYIELNYDMNGHNYVAKRLVNAKSRTQKAFFCMDGQPLSDGKEAEFEQAVNDHFCSKEMYYCSVYTTQNNKGNLLTCPEAKQRELFAEMLGLGELEEFHELAKAKLQEKKSLADSLQAKRDQLESLLLDESAVRLEIGRLTQEAEAHKSRLTEAQKAVDNKKQELANARANSQNVDALRQDLQSLETELAQIQEKIATLDERIKNNQSLLLDRAEDIRAAVLDAQAINEQLPAKREEVESLNQQLMKANEAAHKEYMEAASSYDAKVRQINKDIQDAQSGISALRTRKSSIETQVASLKASLSGHQKTAGLKDETPCNGMEIAPQCQLLKSAFDSANAIQELETQIKDLEAEADAIVIDETLVATLKAQLAELESIRPGMFSFDNTPYKTRIDQAKQEVQTMETRLAELKPLLELAPKLEGALERVAGYVEEHFELVAQQEARLSKITGIKQKIADASDLVETAIRIEAEVRQLEMAYNNDKLDYDKVLAESLRLEGQLENNQKYKDQIAALKQELRQANAVLDAWTLYKQAVSPKGIQALETDAAGPEVTAICNDILHRTYGPRFTVKVETLRELLTKKDKETGEAEQRERFQIKVIDNEKLIEGTIDDKSGGEKAILGEDLSLAIAIYNKKKQKHQFKTLIRDEVTAALTKENGEKYLQMLRIVQDIGGFDQIIYVSHNEDLQGQADDTLHAEGGKVVAA